MADSPAIRDARSGLARLVGTDPVPARAFVFGGAGDRFGAECRWAVRAVSAHERLVAVSEAVKWFTETLKLDRSDLYTETGESALELESKVRGLAFALVDPDDAREQLAKSADEVRKLLEVDEIARLWEEAADFTAERSVFDKAKTWQEVEARVIAVGKGLSPKTSLSCFDSVTLRFIVTELASRLYAPTRPSSSDTSPASDSSDSSTATAPTS